MNHFDHHFSTTEACTRTARACSSFFQIIRQFTPEEAEWYGYSYLEAIDIVRAEQKAKAEAAIKPFKDELRRRLIEDLKASGLEKVERVVQTDKGEYVDMPVE